MLHNLAGVWGKSSVILTATNFVLYNKRLRVGARCAHCRNSDRNAMGVTNHFLIGLKVLSTGGTYSSHFKSGQQFIAGEITGPRGELTTVSQLNRQSIKLPSKLVCVYIHRHRAVWLSHLLREVSLCTRVNTETHNCSQNRK